MSVSPDSSQNIVLIGYRGSGKTTVARLLAQQLDWPLIELDDQIIQAAGCSIKEIFEQHGEAHFRQLETQALSQITALRNHVISLGGGAVLAQINRNIIRQPHNKVIYLKADPAELHRRIHADAATAAMRPNLTHLGGGVEEIRTLLAKREPIYRELAHMEIDVTHLAPSSVANKILPFLSKNS